MKPILTLQQVDFYQANVPLLQGIDLDLYRGKVLGLLGINGAGKSTTLKIATGILTPSKGKVILSTDSRIGYLPETPPLIDTWSVKGFLGHICQLHNIPKAQQQTAIERAVSLCQLDKIFKQAIGTLSKGNRQRVAIAQAIIHQPDILILDEPTSGLDPQQISVFRHLIQEIKPTTAILLSSHIMQEVITLCDEAAIIHQGQKKEMLSLQNQQDIIIECTDSLSVPVSVLEQFPEWQSSSGSTHHFKIADQTAQDKLVQKLLSMNYSIRRISGGEQILENRFLQLIGQYSTQQQELVGANTDA